MVIRNIFPVLDITCTYMPTVIDDSEELPHRRHTKDVTEKNPAAY